MIIGIDLDNTIINYDKTFLNIALKKKIISENKIISKEKLKQKIIKKKSIEQWKAIQGIAYGKNIYHSDIMKFFHDFIILSKIRKIKIYIISHKTKYGHYDKKKIQLRKKATQFLISKKIINSDISPILKSNIYFCDTLDQKISKIKELECDFFIDDLYKVINNKNFPKQTTPILFNRSQTKIKYKKKIINYSSWSEILNYFFKDLSKFELKNIIEFKIKKKINSFRKHQGRLNSKIYKITTQDKKKYSLKIYPNITHDKFNRIDAEFSAYKYLNQKLYYQIPSPIYKLKYLNASLFTWIDGNNRAPKNKKNLEQIIKFVIKLKNISTPSIFDNFNYAKEAVYDKKIILDDIQLRYKRLISISLKNKLEIELKNFLENKFNYLYIRFKKKIINTNNKYLNINKNNLILSPSDLGFNNIILKNKKLYFIDFEYFGLDDPVKLTSDFLWHPSNSLSDSLKQKWLNEMHKIFRQDKNFKNRLNVYYYLYGIKWILIILNIFDPINKKRIFNAKSMNTKQYNINKKKQLKVAIQYYNKIITESKKNEI